MLVHWIWFAHRPDLTDRMKLQLLQHFQDPEEIYFAKEEDLAMVEALSPEDRDSLRDKTLTAAEEILDVCHREKLHILTYPDSAYPVQLKNIPDPPVLLYCKGTLPDLNGSPTVGVVGTRSASAYGLAAAKRMGYQIGRCGGIVVSGMAKGIDAEAMSGAMMAGAPVVGVLGCGADIVYPLANRKLFRDTESYGCILSEFAPGTPPVGWHFPRRNRIISGLSCGVLVVEAPEKSGALITARQALDQGRDVFVVPANIDVASFEGSNQLMRDGAIPAFSGWDVVREYEGRYPDRIHRDSGMEQLPDLAVREEQTPPVKVAEKVCVPKKKQSSGEEGCKKTIDKAAPSPYIDLNDKLPRLSHDESVIVKALRGGERQVDDVIAETGMTTGKLLALLTMLELKGVIRRLPGKRISLK